MTEKEKKILNSEELQSNYVNDLFVNEIYTIIPEVKDDYNISDVMEIICRSYSLGKMRTAK